MQYIKTRWSNNQTHSQSVTFSNGSVNQGPNPIIVSTHRGHPSQISIIHEVRNPSVKAAADMTSPTDSFHSVVSTLNEKKEGKVNLAYAGSSADMNNRNQQHSQSQNSQNQVFHQSYWSWQVPWHTWNQREKIFLLIIVILSLCILSLTSVLSVILQKNMEYREILFDQLGIKV